MTDLERLDEALAGADEMVKSDYGVILLGSSPILAAARAYRDLLAEGAEPDYEAALASWEASRDTLLSDAEAIHLAVDAAIGERLLVVPTTVEER